MTVELYVLKQMMWEHVYHNELNKVKYLLELGEDPNERRFNFSLLMIAAACDNKYMVRLLLDKGADKNLVIERRTAYDCAWSDSIRDILRL